MRSDLPIESCVNAAEELVGAEWEQEEQEDEITVSTVRIQTEEGERRLHRPKGLYVTLECPHIRENQLELHERIINGLTEIWKKFLDPI
ncbi:MAG: GPR endopeptidase, partial [Firmicutes bacterium]|nr:GPR endopeptidase [Bacillota bacterium]